MRFLLSLLALFPAVLWGEACPDAFRKLQEGNDRFTKDQLEHPNRTTERREAVSSTQRPFATIVGCSDSRVAPEILFDQGVGDLFVVRVAGNVVGPLELDSIEYSLIHLGACMIVVLGHENCGAVQAVMEGQTKDIEFVANLVRPAIRGDKTLEEAVKDNVRHVVEGLKKTKVIAPMLAEKKIDVVGGYYHLGTGQVEWVTPLPH